MIPQVEQYLRELKLAGRSPRTISTYKAALSYIDSLTTLQEIPLKWQEKDPVTKAYYDACLRRFARWAGLSISWPRPKTPRKAKNLPSWGVLEAFLEQAPLRDKVLIALILDTGLRISEIVGARWEDWTGDSLVVLGKGGHKRRVWLSPRVQALLLEWKRISPQKIWPRTAGAARRDFRLLCQQLGVSGVTPHTLRHYYATHLIRKGVPLETVRRLLGHAHVTTTARYLHLVDDDLKAAHSLHSPFAAPTSSPTGQ
jgi:integrase